PAPRIAHKQCRRPESGLRLGDKGRHRLRVSDICRDRRSTTSGPHDRVSHRLDLVARARRHRHGGSGRRELLRDRSAHAAPRPGDDCDVAAERAPPVRGVAQSGFVRLNTVVGIMEEKRGTGSAMDSADHAPPCRLCGTPLRHTLVDLGKSPLCESFLTADQLEGVEYFYPLHVRVCQDCLLVQLEAYVPGEDIFTDYAYFSAYSDSWVEHARVYTEEMIKRFGLDGESLVVELASNDGYLLQHFVQRSIPALGIDPAANVAEAARERGVETIVDFFDSRLARRLAEDGRRADLVAANNVLAQVPALNDFVAGIEIVL